MALINGSFSPTLARCPQSRGRQAGQNLVELLFTLPLTLILIFAMLEVTHVWVVYQGVKMAARDAVYTAAIYHSPSTGSSQFTNRIRTLDLATVPSIQIVPINNGTAYKATAKASLKPFYSAMKIPTVGGPVSVLPGLPNTINIQYQLADISIY